VPALVHIVDDDPSFRKSLAKLLQVSGFEVALYESAERILQALPDAGLGCILLDVKMPGLSGPELQDRLAQSGSPLPIIFLSGYSDIPTTVRTVKAGAEDFLAKPIEKKALLEAIRRALERCRVTLEQREQIEALRLRVERLTPREREVFVLVARGHINRQIASVLRTTERTIKAHRQKVMQKLNAQSLLELVAVAERLNMLNADENDTQQPL
jgi:FixJ family two-component response regulator